MGSPRRALPRRYLLVRSLVCSSAEIRTFTSTPDQQGDRVKTMRKRLLQSFLVAAALILAGGLYTETHRVPDQP
jgi:hypothetical protein